ncbi:peptidoglycan-binding protein [Cellvibrio sp. NN19]|uniref:CIS tube protein n=1 Tax=Cellvibrio chitinivorans TaxID=3102792 RepID=UPI002B400439|nr:peptidoglycan-binding protein [Cellvibrio sp. NN19]
MAVANGTKVKLKISPCDVNDGIATVNGDTPFEALINPAGYTHSSSISYAENQAPGPGSEKKYNKSNPDRIEFKELVLDGTGVVEGTSSSVRAQVALLRKVAYDYDGSEHEPPVVEVSWGPLLFKARMEALKVNYTLFKPNGEPLRAKMDLVFTAYKSTEEVFRGASLESPDLTHLVEVKAGDTLPMLCYQIYKDSSYYLAVARLNQLHNFRQLQPGQLLRFPPLV